MYFWVGLNRERDTTIPTLPFHPNMENSQSVKPHWYGRHAKHEALLHRPISPVGLHLK